MLNPSSWPAYSLLLFCDFSSLFWLFTSFCLNDAFRSLYYLKPGFSILQGL
jgi:hypothetical protein